MSANLELLLDAERRADCARNDAALAEAIAARTEPTQPVQPIAAPAAEKDPT